MAHVLQAEEFRTWSDPIHLAAREPASVLLQDRGRLLLVAPNVYDSPSCQDDDLWVDLPAKIPSCERNCTVPHLATSVESIANPQHPNIRWIAPWAPSVSGTSWDYKVMGDDWSGVDGHNKSWSCMSGLHQSPIDLPVSAHIGDPSLISKWSYPSLISNGSNIEVINNGHAIQVEWTSNYEGSMDIVADASPAATITDILSMPDTSEGTKVVTARPLQFHFHTDAYREPCTSFRDARLS
eukprot:gene22503-29629_t